MTATQVFLTFAVVFLSATFSSAQPDPQSEVRTLLQAQQEAWNRRDLDAFMAGYWRSEDLTFFSGPTITRGWQPTLDRYRQHYQSPVAEMGQLEFRNLNIEILGSQAAYARGEYHLTMPSGKTPHGIFTLVLRHFPEGWRIVHDHTSPAE